jgi:hypothetical protein
MITAPQKKQINSKSRQLYFLNPTISISTESRTPMILCCARLCSAFTRITFFWVWATMLPIFRSSFKCSPIWKKSAKTSSLQGLLSLKMSLKEFIHRLLLSLSSILQSITRWPLITCTRNTINWTTQSTRLTPWYMNSWSIWWMKNWQRALKFQDNNF